MQITKVVLLVGLISLAVSLNGCSSAACGADGTGCALLADGGGVDGGQGADGAPHVACTGDATTPIFGGDYQCGTCGTDGFYPVVCVDGYLACPTSYTGSSGKVVEVPAGMYVVGMNDWQSVTGQCAYLAGK